MKRFLCWVFYNHDLLIKQDQLRPPYKCCCGKRTYGSPMEFRMKGKWND